ncbi:MAG: hypothetical protein ACI4KB_11760 [Oscillospiraceae bacterium]
MKKMKAKTIILTIAAITCCMTITSVAATNSKADRINQMKKGILLLENDNNSTVLDICKEKRDLMDNVPTYKLTEYPTVSLEELNGDIFRVAEDGIYATKSGYYLRGYKSGDIYNIMAGAFNAEGVTIEEALERSYIPNAECEGDEYLLPAYKTDDLEYFLLYSEDGENFNVYEVNLPKQEDDYKPAYVYVEYTNEGIKDNKVVYDFLMKYDTADFNTNRGIETETGIYISDITARNYFEENGESYTFGEFTGYDPSVRSQLLHAKCEFTSNGVYTVVIGASNGETCMFDLEVTGIDKSEHIDLGDTTAPNITVDVPKEKVPARSKVDIKVSIDEDGYLKIGTSVYEVKANEVVTYTVLDNRTLKISATDKSKHKNSTTTEVVIDNFEEESVSSDKTGNREFQDVSDRRSLVQSKSCQSEYKMIKVQTEHR